MTHYHRGCVWWLQYPAIGSYDVSYKPTAADLYSVDFLNIASAAAERVVQAVRESPGGKQLPIWMGEGSPGECFGNNSAGG
jgi:hypothetical protein